MTVEDLSAIGVTQDSISQAILSAPCSWVTVVNNEVVAFAMVHLDSGCLFALFVRPGYEGYGIGTALIHTCKHAIFQRHGYAWLETAKNSSAARLCRHLGWGNEVEIEGGDIRLEKRRE
jgi:GNAT superfamily N-acetyltransferase